MSFFETMIVVEMRIHKQTESLEQYSKSTIQYEYETNYLL